MPAQIEALEFHDRFRLAGFTSEQALAWSLDDITQSLTTPSQPVRAKPGIGTDDAQASPS